MHGTFKTIETKTDPMMLESLIEWLETMHPKGGYNWQDCDGRCLIGLYGHAKKLGKRWHDFHSDLYRRNELHIAYAEPHTFGSALERARAALASR